MSLFRQFKKIVSLVLIFSLAGANLAQANVQADHSEAGLLTPNAAYDKPEGIGKGENGRIVLDANDVPATADTVTVTAEVYYSISPESAVYHRGSAQDLTVTVSPHLDGFADVKWNGASIGSENYSVNTPGHTVAIANQFLDSLPPGSYTFQLSFGDVARELQLTISGESNAATGLAWSGAKAIWDEMPGAAGYVVELFKNGTSLGSEASLTNQYDWTGLISQHGPGDYAFKVKGVTADNRHTPDSALSDPKGFGLSITQQPRFQILSNPGTVTLSAAADSVNGDPSEYQWYVVDKEPDAEPVRIEGATGSSYTFAADLADNAKSYYCVITNGVSVASARALLLVGDSQAPDRFIAPAAVTLGEASGKDAVVGFSSNLANYDFWHAFILYKDNMAVDAFVFNAQSNRQSLISQMRAAGSGDYRVSMVTLGTMYDGKSYANSPESDLSNAIAIQSLGKPEATGWKGRTANWNSVDYAWKYELQLCLNDVPVHQPVLIDAPATQYTFALPDAQAYIYTVRALGNPDTRYTDSEPSDQSASYSGKDLALSFDSTVLSKGSGDRLFIDGGFDYVIDHVAYSLNDEDKDKVEVDRDGNIQVKPSYNPDESGDDQVTVYATVSYYEGDDILFVDHFEDDKKFTVGIPGSYSHSTVKPHYGRSAATAVSGTTGPARAVVNSRADSPVHGTVTAWFYDPGDMDQLIKLAFSVQNAANNNSTSNYYALGVVQDKSDTNRYGYYIWRAGSAWNPTDGSTGDKIERSAGWHKFEWVVNGDGMTAKIDGQTAYRTTAVKDIGALVLMTNWNANAGNIENRCFFDDVSVVSESAALKTATVSAQVKLAGKQYTVTPDVVEFDLANKKNIALRVTPDLADLTGVLYNGRKLVEDVDYRLIDATDLMLLKDGFLSSLPVGKATVALEFEGGKTLDITVDIANHEPRAYYVSNQTGNDANDGLTPETAWKSLDKINQTGFNPGDRIFLDAESIWNGQLKLRGSGTEGKAIKLGKYNDGGHKYKRPVINGGGTISKDPYYIFDTNPVEKRLASGAVELVNEEYWEIDGLEVTNLGPQWEIGRNGIMIMNNYAGTLEERTPENFMASKKSHIYVTNSYVHDVNALHQSYGGAKVAGGIIFYGYIDDILAEGNTAIRCDNEGIRNTGFHPDGWTKSGYPAIMKVRYFNNYMANGSGDAMVLSNALEGEVRYNYITGFGKTYLTDAKPNGEGPNITDGIGKYISVANYAALWFMGAKDSVMEYNEVVDNPYNCADGEAFDIDSFNDGAVYQYNYSRNNYGGFMLFMPASKNSVVRYNISIDDGSPQEGSAASSHLFYYAVGGSSSSADYPLIHNNIFKLGANTTRIFGTGSTGSIWTHFYNNIVYGKDTISVFDIGSKSVMTHGSFDYNIIYPETLIDRSKFAAGVYGSHNMYADPATILANIEQSLDIDVIPKDDIPTNGTIVENGDKNTVLSNSRNTGTGKAIARSEFDASKLAGFKLKSADSNAAVGAGFRADQTLAGWRDVSQIFPLTRDFFGNAIRPDDALDIGVQQIGNEGLKAVEFETGRGGSYIPHQVVPVGGHAAKPSTDPTREGYKFGGWYTDESYATAWNFETGTVFDNTVLHAKWIAPTDASPAEKAAADMEALEIGFAVGDTADGVTGNLILPKTGAVYGSTIVWTTDRPSVIDNNGNVKRPAYTEGDARVTITALIINEEAKITKTFAVTVRKLDNTAGNEFTIAPIINQTAAPLTEGYASGSQETKTIVVKRTGTGDLTNLAVALGGADADKFTITQPAATTLNAATPATTFTVTAKNGLAAGTYTAKVTVSAAEMEDVTFTVTQAVTKSTALEAPQQLAAAGGDRRVTLSWKIAAGAVTYAVYKYEGTAAPMDPNQWDLVTSNVTTNSYTVPGLTNGTSYAFVVKAIYAEGASDFSNTATAVPRAAGGNSGSGSDGDSSGRYGGGPGIVASANGFVSIPVGRSGEVSLGGEIIIKVPAGAAGQELRIAIEKLSDPSRLLTDRETPVSSMFQVSKNIGGNLKKPVTLSIKFDAANVGKDRKAAIFYYDDEKNMWIEIGGKVDGEWITVEAERFAKFAVMAAEKEEDGEEAEQPDPMFTDMAGHWSERSVNARRRNRS
ncbi:immunoglobulin-like domain-containing protein [Paenibacillus sp. MSJ-34]|uniref:immunoglobulin-like domain-containing protein n=1 Tax=Paenibacillus sp. MSJ-34 TaxID=2841529 RepID=UPI001C0F3FF5|nr:immunoglobulin-like domain-containing protein [Paenibacillus sp. MSJ-34]MBU5442213.1 InlB B-repeat-containing protein [Paenibacillus sp. MSJ-34]